VWGPGQTTPIHDHRVWGLIGMLRGSEYSQGFERNWVMTIPSWVVRGDGFI
jgi:predicted metal-dependent enzyme (double-stranded beta helix superfamily)